MPVIRLMDAGGGLLIAGAGVRAALLLPPQISAFYPADFTHRPGHSLTTGGKRTQIDAMSDDETKEDERGSSSSPVGRGGAGAYIEGALGAFYLLAMLAGAAPRGLPGSRIERVRFQGVELGYALDDLVVHGLTDAGGSLLEIQSKRTITFASKDGVFKDVCAQIARSTDQAVPEARHLLAVATQRTSYAISGPYQDVLEWSRTADSGAEFFRRLSAKGVAGQAMRKFGATFRANLVAAGATDEDEAIWSIVRRFMILEFDFESNAPLARTHALSVARQVLSAEDAPRAEALWSNLIEISLATSKTGGSIDHPTLRGILVDRGFKLAGDRNLSLARARLAEMARLALADIGNTVAGAHLLRLDAVNTLDEARDRHRFIEIRGGPGVGKSAMLRHLAERVSRESHVFVLDPVGTPEGGWSALSQALGVPTTARVFLGDLAASGGGVLFIDSLEMFTSPGRRRTVNDLLREVSAIEGFSVVVTTRPEFGIDGDSWLAEDACSALGAAHQVTVGELNDEEIEALSEHAPELRALLAPGHPAADIARNLYRLSRLLKVPTSAVIRTEAALADHWWQTADGAAGADVRAAQRMIADLVDVSLAGRDLIEARGDSSALSHLLRSQTLSETRRDNLGFYHDVLRDWAVGARVHEDLDVVSGVNLFVPASPRVARGIEFAGRLALETREDCGAWLALLAELSPVGSHGSWRRQALMAVVRSELSPVLLERCSEALLAGGGALLSELCVAIAAVDTVSTADVLRNGAAEGEEASIHVPRSVRIAVKASAPRLLRWCMRHSGELPLQAIGVVVKLIEIQYFMAMAESAVAEPAAKMLFGWLRQLDVRGAEVTIPGAGERSYREARRRLIVELRTISLLLASQAPDDAKAYLRAITAEKDSHKVKGIRPLSGTLARAAPAEFADLIAASLMEPVGQQLSDRVPRDRVFSFADTDYMPPSPAQPPFLDLLEASPEVGLELVRKLTWEAVSFHSDGADPGTDGFTLVLESGQRFFPWTQTYLWSRDQAREYSVASALMALEAWGHDRIDAGEPIDAVLADVLGPEGSCAAFLLVAVDLLVSHFPASRELLVSFISCPPLLATERGRSIHDGLGRMELGLQSEPAGRVRLADLEAKPSRGVPLERLLTGYLEDDETARRARSLLRNAIDAIGGYKEGADFGDPAFMGAYALNVLDRSNWVPVEGGLGYRSPLAEADHLARLEEHRGKLVRSSEIEAKIQLATGDPGRGSPQVAREAAEFAAGALPDGSDPDVLKARSTRLVATAMLIARDGDDALLDEREGWVREVIARALAEESSDRFPGSSDMLAYNGPALATCALIHLWHRRGRKADRDALIGTAARSDRSAAPAFATALDAVNEGDPRLLKAAVRVAFKASCWRWRSWGEEEAEVEAYDREKAADDHRAVEAEIAWLDGGSEPSWPNFPDEKPIFRRTMRLRIPGGKGNADADGMDEEQSTAAADGPGRVDSQATALWLRIITGVAPSPPDWSGEIVDVYADWSARANGLSYPPEEEVDRSPSEWNGQFYVLVANALMEAADGRFEELVRLVEGLPDQPFGDVAEILIHAVDVRYFNDPQQPPARPINLRERLVRRTMALRRWDRER